MTMPTSYYVSVQANCSHLSAYVVMDPLRFSLDGKGSLWLVLLMAKVPHSLRQIHQRLNWQQIIEITNLWPYSFKGFIHCFFFVFKYSNSFPHSHDEGTRKKQIHFEK
eukprot:TRINITY_DN95496_c0_g1_i1.p1 TRINITY_DN95496_c0_g1~~TRINITY_DN95496_c0_g1_i1.p1  ORF type:complete len:108 (-),score=4.39 TRINITY_DN95496_c0_g1_i1:112-435(-)